MTLRAIFAALLTEDDGNVVPDLARVLWFALGVLAVIGIVLFLVLSVVAVLFARPFDYVAFGGGFAAVLTGVGAMMALCSGALAMKTKSGS